MKDLTIRISVDAKTGTINVVNSQVKNLNTSINQNQL